MHRLIASALMLLASLACVAQTTDPRTVAYVQSARNSANIILAKQDGSKAVTVYSKRGVAGGIDFAPGGGRIAFNDLGALKVLTYNETSSTATATGVTTLVPSGAGFPDYSPDGTNKILYRYGDNSTPTQVREISASGGTPSVLMINMDGLYEVAWFRSSNALVYASYYFASQTDYWQEVHLVTLDPDSRQVLTDQMLLTTYGAPYGDISELEVAHTRNSILVTLGYRSGADRSGIWIAEYHLGSGLTHQVSGKRGHFSADDSKIVYLDSNGEFVQSLDIAAGTTTKLTKRGSFLWVDTRP
jgi:hypothetical protein